MKSALQKSPIPVNHALVVHYLEQSFFDPNWHFHPEYQLFMVLQGSGTRFVGDHVKQFKKGEITFSGPNLPHLWRSDQDSLRSQKKGMAKGIVVYFGGNLISENLMQKEEMIALRQLFKKSLRGIDILGKTAEKVGVMLRNLLQLEGFDQVLGLLQILNLLAKSKEYRFLASPGYTNTLKEGDTDRMNRVYAYVMKHFTQKISVSELAALTNMTPTSFSRYFKIHANKTFSEFLSEIRIGHACKLLIDKKRNSSQACYESGFQTLSNFNRQFKTIMNRTPTEYQKKYLDELSAMVY
ncbi:AraC family transcriptional regulator [Arenibacter sp. GZD96]|uniref:AraC family transcriptional regulator n=1 Tax=Aurantibrevibacter litoralis TaxID=3106030 RepID=UPI002B00330F|nr:AraC family transcriptional regulator [Arenibacter sp. GZD-96]MEA1784518.1 AraC family transcriptional regulator [Arenibacter sp. GZD-96]